MAQPLGTVNLDGEEFQVFMLDHTDGEWAGFYEVRDDAGLVFASGMTESMAIKGALVELEFQKCEIDEFISYALKGV